MSDSEFDDGMKNRLAEETSAAGDTASHTDGDVSKSSVATWWRSVLRVLSSMRFAVSLLTVICIASVVGTVLQQGRDFVSYADKFGFFWAGFFRDLGLFDVYGAWWFLLILAFLVISTSLCVYNNAPQFLRQMRQYKEHVALRSLKAMGFHTAFALPNAAKSEVDRNGASASNLAQGLADQGWKVKLQTRGEAGDSAAGTMLAAKRGAANKLGYIAAHLAIVLICIGGLLDGSLLTKLQVALGNKQAFTGTALVSEIGESHRLSADNVSFRGNMRVSEGAENDLVILNQPEGILLQELSFSVRLKKFIVEHYSTGMPKLFASEIELVDKDTGAVKTARVEVNKPVTHRGVSIYQSDFGDGGSLLRVQPMSLFTGLQVDTEPMALRVGSAQTVQIGGERKIIEPQELRVFNVNDLTGATETGVGSNDSIQQQLNKMRAVRSDKKLRNVGPSIVYKLRDDAGQAREFHNYMLPVQLNENEPAVFLFGVRDSLQEDYRYLRIAADEQGSMQGFLHLRAALADPALRKQAAQRFAVQAVEDEQGQGQGVDNAAARAQSMQNAEQIASMLLDLFAGDGQQLAAQNTGTNGTVPATTGLQAIADFIEQRMPPEQAQQDSMLFVRVLNGALWELMQISREIQGKPALEQTAYNQAWLLQNVVSLSDVAFYPEPRVFVLKDFQQVQMSVFQLTKAPARWLVYLGCALLIVGVFAMLFVRERRLWLWLPAAYEQGNAASDAKHDEVLLSMSSNRKLADEDDAFAQLQAYVAHSTGLTPVPAPKKTNKA